jgi:tetratricopeptide (TPR) repeat protein
MLVRPLWVAAVIVAVTVSVPWARAWGDAARDARHHVRDGKAKLAAGDADGALAEFEAACKLAERAPCLLGQAQAWQKKGERAKALELYRKAAASAPDGADKQAAQQGASAIEQQLADEKKAADEKAQEDAQREEDRRVAEQEAENAHKRADAQKAEDERRAREERAQREADERKQRNERAQRAYARRREDAKQKRIYGWALASTGAALALGGGFFWWASSTVNDDIKSGKGYPSDYKSAQADGMLYNSLAWSFGAGAALCLGAGLPILLRTHDPEAPRLEAGPVAGGGFAVGLSGAW